MAEPVLNVVKQYRGEFEETYDGLRKRAVQLQENAKTELAKYQERLAQLQPQILQQKDELVKTLQDVSAPIEDASAPTKLMETLLWTGVIQFGYHAAFLLLGSLFASVVGVFFDSFHAILLAYVLLPVAALLHIRSSKDDTDRITRFKLLGFAAAEGVLTGFLLSDSYLGVWQPAPYISTALLAAAAPIVAEKLGKTRTTFLGATVGSGLVAQLILGLASGNLSLAYLLLIVGYAGIGFATVQFYLKYSSGDVKKAAYYAQLGYFLAALYLQALVFGIFSVSGEKLQRQQEGQADSNAAAAASAKAQQK